MNSSRPTTDSQENPYNVGTAAGTTVAAQGELPIGRYALFFLPLVIGLGADLWTKSYMFKHYFDPTCGDRTDPSTFAPQQPVWWVDGIFGIQTSTNPGALFGIGSGYSSAFAAFSVVAVVGILVWLFFFRGFYDRWLTFALGMITGGILGNLYDRVGFGHTPGFPESIRTNVRDWILFRLEGVRYFDPWPNFNIADALLVTGAIMLFLHAMFFAEPVSSEDTEASEVGGNA